MRPWTSLACACALACSSGPPKTRGDGLDSTPTGRDIAVDIRVCADGSGQFEDIQPAINASRGDTVIGVCPGTYGPIELLWGKQLTIVGLEGPEVTTIDGAGSPAVQIDEGVVTLQGFRLTGTGVYDQWFPKAGGISLFEGTATIRDCIVEDSSGPFALLFDEDYLEMDRVVWRNNTSDYLWFLWQGEDDAPEPGWAVITRNIVDGGTHYALIETTKLVDLRMSNNIFANTKLDTGFTAFIFNKIRGGTLSVTNNVFYNLDDLSPEGGRLFTGEADFRNNIVVGSDAWDLQPMQSSYSLFWNNGVDYAPFVEGEGNLFVDPKFVDPEALNFTLQSDSPAINAGDPDPAYNDLDGTRNDMGRYGGPLK